MPKITVPILQVEAVDIPAGQVPVLSRGMPGYRIAAELVGRNVKL